MPLVYVKNFQSKYKIHLDYLYLYTIHRRSIKPLENEQFTFAYQNNIKVKVKVNLKNKKNLLTKSFNVI